MQNKEKELEFIKDFLGGFGKKPENKQSQDEYMREKYPGLFKKYYENDTTDSRETRSR